MCGLCGVATTGSRSGALDLLRRMTKSLAHRGPDGDGFFHQEGVGIGHRRLSIIDIEGGGQPLFNEDQSVVVFLNGEIYNYQELTRGLLARGHTFKTQSDTEVLVHLYEEEGMNMLHRLRGMFVFALYDRKTKTLFVVRDRFGIKPVYYHQHGGRLLFASEIKALLEGGYSVEVNPHAVHLYLSSRFAHGDETIFKGIFRLPEGSYLRWQGGSHRIHRYYPNPPHESYNGHRDFQKLFEEAFSDAVASHMIADVPVGAYLSGGVDSSMVVSEMVRLTGRRVSTFCVDFTEGRSEAQAAEETAKSFGCEHHTVLCGVPELLELPRVIRTLEEPVGDGVVVAQFVLSQATQAAGIKVVLTGDGADETLGGYQYLRAIITACRWGRWLPQSLLCGPASALARRLPLKLIEFLAALPLNVARDARDRLAAMLQLLPRRDPRDLYDLLLSLYCPEELKKLYTDSFYSNLSTFPVEHFAGDPSGRTFADRVLSLQYRKWLPANINLKQDKLCMAHSVENRVPFLDHRFVELLATFPTGVKIRGRDNKLLLRTLAKKRLKRRVAQAIKTPFHLPLEHYLKDARLWRMIEDNLEPGRIACRGIVRPQYVSRLRTLAVGGDYLAAKKMFALVILEMWHRIFLDKELA